MSQTELNTAAVSWRDYLELCKPNVVALMILTSVIGMVLATQQSVPLSVLIFGNLGIALCAGSAAAVNHIVDRHVDDKMARTLNRPLAQGRITPRQAILFALITGLLGMAILLIFTNVLTAWLTLASLVGYAFIYTMFLKRATPQNIVIGGLAGAAPPLLGWTAVTGEIHHNALLLVLIIFAWREIHENKYPSLYPIADYCHHYALPHWNVWMAVPCQFAIVGVGVPLLGNSYVAQ
jgi:protoheme IX farnesyltransferase